MKVMHVNTKLRILLPRLFNLAMVLVFILLSLVIKPYSDYKPSEIKKYEKSKNNYPENDFLLFEEDDERLDNKENDKEWLRNFAFDVYNRSIYINPAILSRNLDPDSYRRLHNITQSLPLFISIRSIKI